MQHQNAVGQTVIVDSSSTILIRQQQLLLCISPHKFFFPKTGIWSKDLYSTGPVRM